MLVEQPFFPFIKDINKLTGVQKRSVIAWVAQQWRLELIFIFAYVFKSTINLIGRKLYIFHEVVDASSIPIWKNRSRRYSIDRE
ncbi:MAG: hypothetical protein ACK559_40180 [bacterium]